MSLDTFTFVNGLYYSWGDGKQDIAVTIAVAYRQFSVVLKLWGDMSPLCPMGSALHPYMMDMLSCHVWTLVDVHIDLVSVENQLCMSRCLQCFTVRPFTIQSFLCYGKLNEVFEE